MEIISSADLKVEEEIHVVKTVEAYLTLRDALRPLLPEEDPGHDPALLAQLSEAELKARADQQAAKEEEEKKATKEAAQKETEAVAGMDAAAKVQHASDKKQEGLVKEARERVVVKRLSKAEKDQLVKAIRYAHMQHTELIEAAKNPSFSNIAKDYIMQGLSYRLKPFEAGKEDIEKEYTIELKPRNHYKKEEPPKKEEVVAPPKKDEEVGGKPTVEVGKKPAKKPAA